MDLSTSAILYYSVFAAAGFVIGALLASVIAYAVADKKRRAREAEEAMTEQIMTGLNRSCEGVDSVISTLNLSSLNLPKVKKDLAKRVSAIDKRVQQYADQVEPFFVAYMALRIDGYRRLLVKMDDLAATVVGFGGHTAPAGTSDEAAEPDSGEIAAPQEQIAASALPAAPTSVSMGAAAMASVLAPVAAVPAPQEDVPAMSGFEPSPSMAFAPAAPEAAPEIDVGATMAFDTNMEPQAPAPFAPMAAQSFPPFAPAAPLAQQQPEPAPDMQQAAPAEDDMMYGQTMQFSMSDIDAARKGADEPQQAPDIQPTIPDFVQAGFAPTPSSPMVGSDGGETVLFAVDENAAPAPAQQAPQYFAPQIPSVGMPQMQAQQMAPAPMQPAAPPKPQKSSDSGNLITGNDLMDQMDAFFNFKE